MPHHYKETIAELIAKAPYGLDPHLLVTGRPPTMASSDFLTNKEQGDWAEQIVVNAINLNSHDYFAVHYGHSGTLAAGDEGFEDFYISYQNELNQIGKRPDVLVFKRSDFDPQTIDLNEETVSRAIAAIEVRSSSFLVKRYSEFMQRRTRVAVDKCVALQTKLRSPPYASILQTKSPEVWRMIDAATIDTFRNVTFRRQSWSSTPDLRAISEMLTELKDQIEILHRRDYLSITPKVEDLVLVNRWIQRFNVRHYYLQVFFDKAYVIPFRRILEVASDSEMEDILFSVEGDVKNQGKRTIKINVLVGKEILGRIDMPEHRSSKKELDRGRLLFYVTFQGGKGYLDHDVFVKEIIDDV